MGKHETGYARVERDLYPTPSWMIDALAEHVDLRWLTVWEPDCGSGDMAEALRRTGCAGVYMSDIVDGGQQHELLDFTSERNPEIEARFNAIVTNPPFGQSGTLASAFITAGLKRLGSGGLLALLLPCDFDSAKTWARYFADCPDFVAKIALTRRIVWFQRDDGIREAPKENHAWFLWHRSPLCVCRAPVILYAPSINGAAERAMA